MERDGQDKAGATPDKKTASGAADGETQDRGGNANGAGWNAGVAKAPKPAGPVYGDDSDVKEAPERGPVPRLDLGGKKAKPPAPAKAGRHGGEGKAGDAPAAGPARATPDPKANAAIKTEVTRTAPGNADKGRTSVGVGEDVLFTHAGDGEWTADGKSLGAGGMVPWKAPAKAGSVEIAHAVAGGQAQKQIIRVIAPGGTNFTRKGGVPVPSAGVSMTLKVTVLPEIVSFGACEWQEVAGGADGVNGYFSAYTSAGLGDLAHHPAEGWINMGDNNAMVEDHAYSYGKPPLPNPAAGGAVGYWGGAFGWNIPTKYRVAGAGDGEVFTTIRQGFTMDDAGAMSVQKGGANATQNADGKVQGDMVKCATVREANALLNPLGRTGAVQLVMLYNANPDKDPVTQKNLVAALKGDNIQFYVGVACDNTYNYVTRDLLDFVIKGPSGSHNESVLINSGKSKSYTFPLEQLLDYNTMVGGPVLFKGTNDDNNAFVVMMPSVLEPLSKAGGTSRGHYQITAFIQKNE